MSPQHVVVLLPSQGAAPAGYDVRLGPLYFVTTADTVREPVGDGLEAVGSAVVAAERRPRQMGLKLPIRGLPELADPAEAGRVLRRQVRALMDNARYRLGGFYFMWEADPDLDGWYKIGSADINETDPGITFGEYDLELNDVYIVGRPGTHRPGRRAAIATRETGMVERDTRRLLYSDDFEADFVALTEPLVLPGDVTGLVASGYSPVDSATPGPLRGARRLWRAAAALDGEIVTYLPDPAVLVDRNRFISLEEFGAVRVWNGAGVVAWPPNPADYTTLGDTVPDAVDGGYGWERVFGSVLTEQEQLAMENGTCRLLWMGSRATQGLAIETWDEGEQRFVRVGRVLHRTGVSEQRVIELTPERGVIEWRNGEYGMRAILQRGWPGPRLESYNDSGGSARLEYAPELGATTTLTPQAPAWVREVTTEHVDQPALTWASQSADEVASTTTTVVENGAAWSRDRVLVAQLGVGSAAGYLASLSLTDARAVPVLLGV